MGVRWLATAVGATLGGCVMVVAAAVPAVAKGPTEATVTFPGGGSPVDVGGDGENPTLGNLAEALGLWSSFGSDGNPTLTAEPPVEPVGEPFVVRWTMSSPDADDPVVITQELYMVAPSGGLVYTEPGQDAGPYGPSGVTVGGWFQAPEYLSAAFGLAGLTWEAPMPDTPPGTEAAATAAGETGGRDSTADNGSVLPEVGLAVAAVGAVAAAAAGGMVVHRRRERHAAAATG
jgi:hypothetical protein